VKNLLFIEPQPPAPPTAADVVHALETARKIVNVGWTQHCGFTSRTEQSNGRSYGVPCYCTVAAVTRASRTAAIRKATLMAVRMALPARWKTRTIDAFNDDKNTRVGDVTWLLVNAKSFAGTVVRAA
jgi:hypothetical protein